MTLRLRDGSASDHAILAEIWEAAWTETMPAIDFAGRRPLILEQLREAESGRSAKRPDPLAAGPVGLRRVTPRTNPGSSMPAAGR